MLEHHFGNYFSHFCTVFESYETVCECYFITILFSGIMNMTRVGYFLNLIKNVFNVNIFKIERLHFTVSPDNCPSVYRPVCGANGKVYPNNCTAMCSGVKVHACQTQTEHSCSHRCQSGHTCFPRHQVCLNDLKGETCPQFECSKLT